MRLVVLWSLCAVALAAPSPPHLKPIVGIEPPHSNATGTVPPGEDWCIGNFGINVCGSWRVAGSIDYIAWNNMQFVNAYDHGRELQFAISTHAGECYNPTEAGSGPDGVGAATTSVLQGLDTSGNVFRTTGLPAFWMIPGQCEAGCGCALNVVKLSSYQTSKAISFAPYGWQSALQYLTTVVVPENQPWLQIEIPTGYMPINFNTFFTISLATGVLTQVSQGPDESADPVIISDPSGNWAMGAFLVSNSIGPDSITYARFIFPSSVAPAATSKWSIVWRSSSGGAGFHAGEPVSFESIVCLGALPTVQQCMAGVAAQSGWVH